MTRDTRPVDARTSGRARGLLLGSCLAVAVSCNAILGIGEPKDAPGDAGGASGAAEAGGVAGAPGAPGAGGEGARGEAGAAGEAGEGAGGQMGEAGAGGQAGDAGAGGAGGTFPGGAGGEPPAGNAGVAGAPDCGELTLCGNDCADLASDPDHCRSCDTSCPGPASHGQAVCDADGCGIECDPDSLLCGDECCDPAPSHAEITCLGNQCGAACLTNYHACSTTSVPCYPDDDVQHCGANCQDCRQPNASSECMNGECDVTCLGPTLACDDGYPRCGSWSFESQATEGWYVDMSDPLSTDGWDGRFDFSTDDAHTGTTSLAIGFAADATEVTRVIVRNDVCGGYTVGLEGATLSFWVAFMRSSGSPALPELGNYSFVSLHNSQGDSIYGTCDFTAAEDTWVHVQGCSFGEPLPMAGIDIILRVTTPVAWRGTVYLDEITLEPP